MKEFIFGGLVTMWIICLGLSTVNTVFTYASIILPLLVAGVLYNFYLIKQIRHKQVNNKIKR